MSFTGINYLAVLVAAAASFALGAAWLERHFTLDRTWKGTDHAASLEPSGFRKLCRDIEAVALAWRDKPAEMMDIEAEQARKLKRSITSCSATQH